MSDKEVETNIDKMLGLEDQELQLKKKYITEFKKAIPVKKIILLPKAETEFKKALLNILKEKKGKK